MIPHDELIDVLRSQAAAAERFCIAARVADLRREQITAPLQSVRDSAASRARLLVAEADERRADA